MFSKITLIALVGALSVSANQVSNLLARSEHSPFLARQITAAQIPAACQSQCTSAISIYQSCTTGDNAGCLAVCQPSNFSGFVGCLQCVLSNTPGVSASETSALNAVLGQLGTACSAAGQAVSSTTLVAGSATGSASASGGSASGASASVSSAIASVTGSGSSSRVSGASSSGALASISNVANSASSVAASASSSRAAGDAVAMLPQGLETIALSLVGLVAGAAYIL